MDNCVTLENWFVTDTSDPYTAPENIDPRLCGTVFNHPEKPDGASVVTSRIVRAEGLFVKTYSGTTYKLGAVKPDYLEWLRSNYPEFDPSNPIKFK